MIIQIVLLLFIFFILSRVFLRYREKDITRQEFIVWLVFWVLVAIAVAVPKQTDGVAQFLGVSRGADLLVYISIIVLFFSLFKIKVSVVTLSRNITALSKKIAVDNARKPHDDKS